MKKLLFLASLALIPAGCTPDVQQMPPPAQVAARFDPAATPPVVPVPTDLAKDPQTGRLAIPINASQSPAEQEFNSYLNTLNGYPPDTPGAATFDGPLRKSSVNNNSVRILDLTAGSPVTNATLDYFDIPGQPGTTQTPNGIGELTISAPLGGWQTGHQYAVALVGGTNGLQGANGEPVVGSPAWALLAAQNSLVTCTAAVSCMDLTNLNESNCRSATEIIPSSQTDPAARIQDQAHAAVQLEAIRCGYQRVFTAFTGLQVNRQDIVLLWTFGIATRPTATFDPANNVIPFPNNLVLAPSPDGGAPHVNLPIPDGGTPLLRQLLTGLNTLDGFSTTAPLVSVNQDYTTQRPLPAISAGQIDPATLLAGTGILKLAGGTTTPRIVPCLDCTSSKLADGGVPNNPQQLQLVPGVVVDGGVVPVPLDERSTYVAYVTDSLKDAQGNSVAAQATFALLRSSNPLITSSGKSAVSVVSDANARQLEPARLLMKPGFDALQAAGIPRSRVVLAWVFTTQTEITALRQIQTLPQVDGGLNPLFVFPESAAFFVGELNSPFLLTGPSSTLNPASQSTQKLEFWLFKPSGNPPAGGFPVSIFGHGLTRSRQDAFALAALLTGSGQVVISTDAPYHGNRTDCRGSSAVIDAGVGVTDDNACANPNTQMCNPASGRCVVRTGTGAPCDPGSTGGVPGDLYCEMLLSPSQGNCLMPTDGGAMTCEGGDFAPMAGDPFGTPAISGWNILNLTNLFTTRDNFRQQVADLAHLTRALSVTGPSTIDGQLATILGVPEPVLDRTRINYLGQSLGSILGSLYTSTAPEIHNVALNVAGADPANVLLLATDPTFVAFRGAFFNTLHEQGIDQGTKAFDQFIGIAKWTLDPADPANTAYFVTNPTGGPANRKAFIQYITQDPVISNPTTIELIGAANRPGGNQANICLFDPSTAVLPVNQRHGFLLNGFHGPTTFAAQSQVAAFLNTGTPTLCPY